MKLPQLLHSTRSYGRANSAFSWKLLVLERGFLSYRLKLPCDRLEKDAWFGYSPAGALRKLPFILYSRPAEDWLQRSGSSSTISPTTLFFAISARGRHNYSRSQPAVARANKLPWPTGGVFSCKSRTAGGGARSAGTGLWLVCRGVRHGRSQSRQGVARRTRLNTVIQPKFRREWQLRRQLKRPLQSRA